MTNQTELDALIARVQELDKVATPGPWRTSMSGYSVKSQCDEPEFIVAAAPGGAAVRPHVLQIWVDKNSDLIAEYRTLTPRLAAECQRLTAELAEKDDPDRCHKCDRPVPDSGDMTCVDCVQSMLAEKDADIRTTDEAAQRAVEYWAKQLREKDKEIQRLEAVVAKQIVAELQGLATNSDKTLRDTLLFVDTKRMKAEAQLRAVETLRDELLRDELQHGLIPEGIIADKLTAILSPPQTQTEGK